MVLTCWSKMLRKGSTQFGWQSPCFYIFIFKKSSKGTILLEEV